MAKSFNNLVKEVEEREKRILAAANYGRRVGVNVCRKYSAKNGGINTINSSEAMSEMLYKVYMAEGDCGKLFAKWTIGKLYKKLWTRHFMPILNRIYDLFVENGVTRKNPHSYGEYDGHMWYEKPKDCRYKVLIFTSYCACAEDSTYIFIWNDDKRLSSLGPVLHVRTLFNKSRKNKRQMGHMWGDHRDYERMSLAIFRKHNFEIEFGNKLGYGDSRDSNYVLSMNSFGNSSDGAYTSIPRIEHAQWIVDYMRDEAENLSAREEN